MHLHFFNLETVSIPKTIIINYYISLTGSGSEEKLVEVGTIYLNHTMVFTQGNNRENLWIYGIPLDGSPLTQHSFPIKALTIFAYIFAGANIICAVIGMIFMTIFRNRR